MCCLKVGACVLQSIKISLPSLCLYKSNFVHLCLHPVLARVAFQNCKLEYCYFICISVYDILILFDFIHLDCLCSFVSAHHHRGVSDLILTCRFSALSRGFFF